MDAGDKAETLSVPELMDKYSPVKGLIETRLGEFRHIWKFASDEELFRELVFCLLTPQSKAKTCWKAVQRLDRKCMIDAGEPSEVSEELVGVRFNQRKAEYICLARSMFCERSLRGTLAGFAGSAAAREWLVENVKGLGYKETSAWERIWLSLTGIFSKIWRFWASLMRFPVLLQKRSTLRSRRRWPPSPRKQESPWGNLTFCYGTKKQERCSNKPL
jgi:hypothetical protein